MAAQATTNGGHDRGFGRRRVEEVVETDGGLRDPTVVGIRAERREQPLRSPAP